MPAAGLGDESLGFGRSPGAGLVFEERRLRCRESDRRSPMTPRRRPDARRARRRPPSHRRAAARRHPSRRLRACRTNDSSVSSPIERLARPLDARADRDRHFGAEPEADVVAVRRAPACVSGGRFSSTTTSVVVTGRHLPARMKNGTPSQRHESIVRRTAAKVSTCESGATPVFVPVAAVLAAHQARRIERPDHAEHLDLLVANRLGIATSPAAPSPGSRAPAACGSE